MHRGEVIDAELLSSAEKRELIERVTRSSLFLKAPRLREFLLYVAECSIESRFDDVREQVIAEKVFHRNSDYDLQDGIVRAEARNLRRRLETYFDTDGRGEPIAVLMPKGGYSLAFERRALTAEVSEALLEAADPANGGPRGIRFYRVACAVLAVISICAIVLAVYWRSTSRSGIQAAHAGRTLPFSALFDPALDTYIVTSDDAVLQILQLSGQRINLSDYILRSYPPIPHVSPPNLVDMLNHFEYTNGDEMAVAGSIMRKNAPWLGRTFLRSGHQVQLSDFKRSNIILIGSPLSNPWAQLYVDRVNFQFDLKPGQGIIFRNRSPRTGERAEYPAPNDVERHWSYAHLVFLPGAPETGSTLLIAGTTAGATTAAGEFLLDEARLGQAIRSAGMDPAGPPKYFELLLRATTFLGGATQSEVIAWRSGRAATP